MLKIYGASDDLIEIEGDHNDEINSIDEPVDFLIGWDEATQGENARGVRVRVSYGDMPGATWGATIAPVDEDVPIPWGVTVSAEGYSAVVQIDCPKGTPVVAFVDGNEVWRDGKRAESDDE